MWDSTQALRQLANTLFGISLLLVLFGAVRYALKLPEFALSAVQLSSMPHQIDTTQIEYLIHKEIHGNFFTVDLDATRKSFEKLPWVRKVTVRRQFPWLLAVDLEEHVALARWNDTELVNTHGEIFSAQGNLNFTDGTDTHPTATNETNNGNAVDTASIDQRFRALPKFIGQLNTASEVTRMYKIFNEQLAPLKLGIAQVSLSPRNAWQLRLDNGMILELGREKAQERLARFVEVYPTSLAAMHRPVNSVDLRYSNGFAVYLPG